MSKVDWSLAPEGATHFRQDSRCYSTAGIQYYMLLDDQWFYWAESLGAGWKTCHRPCGPVIKIDLSSSKPWSGPEDGLPPVGTKCRVVKVDGIDAPLDAECKIVAHEMNGENMVAVYMYGKPYEMYAGIGISHCFSLIKELDARETAIREIMDVADVDCRVTAARLVDAGFKREVV